MEQFSQNDLKEALKSLQSTLNKCEKVNQKLPSHTLTIRRIKALKLAINLINEKIIQTRKNTLMYNETVLKEFASPQNVGEMPDANGVGQAGNESCGDVMRIYIKVVDDVIVDTSFLTFGCAAAIASSSMATSMIKGKTIKEALKLTNKQVVEKLDGLPAQKVHCSVMAEEAVQAAINNYKERLSK